MTQNRTCVRVNDGLRRLISRGRGIGPRAVLRFGSIIVQSHQSTLFAKVYVRVPRVRRHQHTPAMFRGEVLHDGDSGSPVFSSRPDGTVLLVGIYIARNSTNHESFVSRFSRICNDFGGLNATRGAQLATPAISGSVSNGLAHVSWPAVSLIRARRT